MRVVHLVCSTGFAGVERYIVTVASGLASSGDDVVVIGGDADHMQRALAQTSVQWLPGDDMGTALSSLRSIEPPDILHTHMSQADLVGWFHLRRHRRPQHVSTRHFAGRRGSNPLSRLVFRPVGRSLAAQIAISRFVAEHVEPPVEVVHTGVESTDAAAERRPYVLAAQRLEAEKHTADVIEAWALSRGPAAGWKLRIAGDGSERGDLEALARERGVAGSVEFLGHRSDVPALLAEAGIVIAPTPREGLGILVLEAMAAGAPTVAAAGGGHLETVGAARPDLLFAPGDPADAARVLDDLLRDPARREAAGAALRDLQRRRFSVERQVAQTRRVYEHVLVVS